MRGSILGELKLLLILSVVVLPLGDLQEAVLTHPSADTAVAVLLVVPPTFQLDLRMKASHSVDLHIFPFTSIGKVATLPDSGTLRPALHNVVIAPRETNPLIKRQLLLIHFGHFHNKQMSNEE